MTKKNTGRSAQDHFEGILKLKGKTCFVYRVTDTAEVRGRSGAGFTKPQPADYVVVEGEETFFAEVKSSNNKTSFPFGNIETTQFAYAKMIVTAGGGYFFFLRNEITLEWYKVPASVFLSSEKKSATWEELSPFKWRT